MDTATAPNQPDNTIPPAPQTDVQTSAPAAAPPTAAPAAPLPTMDEAFGKPADTSVPTMDEAFGKAPPEYMPHPAFVDKIAPMVDHFVNTLAETAMQHILKTMVEDPYALTPLGAFQRAGEKTYQLEKDAINNTFINPKPIDYSDIKKSGEGKTAGTALDMFNRSVLQGPVGTGFTILKAPAVAALSPLFDVGVETLKKEGTSSRAIDTFMAAGAIIAVAHTGGVDKSITEGIANHTATAPEDVAMGITEPSPQTQAAANRVSAMEGYTKAYTDYVEGLPHRPDIHEVARNLQPELFNEADRIDARQEVLRDNLRNSDAVYGKEVDDQIAALEKERAPLMKAPIGLTDEELQRTVAENNEKYGQLSDQIKQLKDNREELIKQKLQQDQKEYIDNFHRRAELSPQVNKAYNDAKEWTPEPPEEEAPAAQITPVPPVAEQPAEIHPLDTRISDDFSKKLQDIGRPKDEADAQAAIVAAHYKAVADQGWAKGTPLEIYQRHVPVIAEGQAKEAKRILSLSQKPPLEQPGARGSYIRAFGDYIGGVIGLRPGADASTLIHEIGHAWLDEMTTFSKEADAPQNLLDHMKTLRTWLGAKEGEEWTRGQHEKFARGFERYTRDGIAPSKALEQVFIKFRQWLTDIYKNVSQLRVTIPENVRNVFDHLLEATPDRVKPTVIAPERTAGKSMADIHEADAATTPPAQKDKVADNVEKEIDATVKSHAPEVLDAIKAAETSGVAEPATDDTAAAEAAQPAGQASAPAEPGTIAGGSSAAPAGGAGLPEQPATEPASAAGPAITPNTGGAGPGEAGRITNTVAPIGTDQPGGGRSGSRVKEEGTNIRFENISKEKDFLNAVREKAKNSIYDNESVKTITQREMSDLALAAGDEAKNISLDKLKALALEDGVPLAVHVRIVRQELIDSEKRLSNLQGLAENGSDEDVANFVKAMDHHVMVGKTLSAAQAEIARGLGSGFVDISKGDLKNAQELSEFLQSATGKSLEDYRKIAAAMSRMKEKGQISKFVNDSAKPDFIDKLQAYRDIALLSGPVTHLTYVNANLINQAMRIPERYAASKLAQLSGSENDLRGEASAMAYAFLNKDALRNMTDSWRTYTQILPNVEKRKFTSLAPQLGEPMTKFQFAQAQVPRAIGALHSFQYTIAEGMTRAALAVRQAKTEGLTLGTDAFAKRVTEIRQNPSEEMKKQSSEEALKEVNMGKSGGTMGKLSLLVNSNRALKWLFPFIKMEAAAKANAYAERTPLGYLSKDIRANLSGANGEVARDIQRGKMTANMVIAGSLYALGSQFVNDDGPESPDERRIWSLTHCPNSVQVGDVCFALKNMGRMGEFLKAGATIHRTLGDWYDGEKGDKVAADFTNNLTHDLTDGTFTENMKNLTDVLYNPKEYGAGFMQNFATSLIPFSVGLSQVARLVDPFNRDTKAEGASDSLGAVLGNSMKIADAAASKIPGLSYMLEPKYDVFGTPTERGGSYTDRYKHDDTAMYLDSLHMGVGYLKPQIQGVQLDEKQYAEYALRAGVQVKDSLDKLLTQPGFKQRPLNLQVQTIHEVITSSRQSVAGQMIWDHPELREKVNNFQRLTHGWGNQ